MLDVHGTFPEKKGNLNQELGETVSRLRDVSIRDGVQSWDGNRWKIDDILDVAKELDKLATVMKETTGHSMAPVEAWGGGQVAQPAKFLKEDPFINLEKIHDAAPNLELQCLYRGRQGFGFIPVSDEIQKAAIESAASRGVKVFRIFDMMNDIDNVTTGIGILKDYKAEHPDSGVRIEGAISYISEPKKREPGGEKRAWELSEYADYAVKMAQKGCDAIAIKNYAGVGDYEMKDLIKAIRGKLDAAGFQGMEINLHTHGEKVDVLADALAAGASKVDVAIGKLGNGPSHTNMRDVIQELMAVKGYDQDAVDAHPVMQQLAKVEAAIEKVVERTPASGKSFDDARGPLKNLDKENIERFRMAGGALSDLWARSVSQFPNNQKKAEALFRDVLEETPALWEKAGRFNTVTPGAKILTDQASKVVLKKMLKEPFTMEDYDSEYLNIATGRFGRNQGMEKGIGDTQWRDAVLIFRALGAMNEALQAGEISKSQSIELLSKAGLGAPGARVIVEESGAVKLDDPHLEAVLKTNDAALAVKTGKNPLQCMEQVVAESTLPEALKQRMLAELKPGRAASPTQGLAEGRKVISGLLESMGVAADSIAERSQGTLSNPDTLALEAMLLRSRGKSSSDDSIIKGLMTERLGVKTYEASVAGSQRQAAAVSR
jgi:pyruvate/oxaloacetate carboxyltransferase